MGNCIWNNCRWLFRCISIRGGRAIMIIILIIIGMSLVTMIPRVIPAFVVGQLEFKSWLNRWLNAIPYAALGALIFPGIMSVQEGQPHIGLVGGLVAIRSEERRVGKEWEVRWSGCYSNTKENRGRRLCK